MLFIVVGLIFAVVLTVLISSPGKLPPLKDEQGKVIPGSISEKTWVEVNGIKQGMFIRGENPQNPVILYLHGGPGTPLLQFISFLEKSERLEKYFTVCYWDQRGSGMTYTKDTDISTLTLEQMVEDTRVVTEYLKSRFGQEKIYLIGHSWGSYLGVKTIEKYPENYLAYVGIGQVTNQTESERLAHKYMLNHAKTIHDKDVIEKLEAYNPSADDFPSLDYLMKVRPPLSNKYKIGHIHTGVTNGQMMMALFVFKGYTIAEKMNWIRGADFSMPHLYPLVLKDNLFESAVKFEIPFYIMQGAYDYQVSQVLAKQYLDTIDAPAKEYYEFADSAHSPNMEEPERFVELFQRIAFEHPQLLEQKKSN